MTLKCHQCFELVECEGDGRGRSSRINIILLRLSGKTVLWREDTRELVLLSCFVALHSFPVRVKFDDGSLQN